MAEEIFETQLVPAQPTSLKHELNQQIATLAGEAAGAELATQARSLADRLLGAEVAESKTRQELRNAVENMGCKLQVQAARKSAMLKQPIHTLSLRGEEGGPVANALMDLRVQVESLDPARFDLSAGWLSRIVGYLPFVGTPLKRYFSRYEAASSVIEAIVASLESGREQLKRDNITLQGDQEDMRELSKQLQRAIALGQMIDTELSARLETEIPQDDPRFKFVQEELLFPLRQRIVDLQQQLAVNQQAVLTMEIIIRNNKELIRGVNRATSVTVNALQIAVTLALALANQRIVLQKIEAVNKTTDSLIANTASQLRQQGAAIHQQAASAQLSVDTLRAAFADINGAIEDIASFRREALPTMAATIVQLDELTTGAEESLAQIEAAGETRSAVDLDIS